MLVIRLLHLLSFVGLVVLSMFSFYFAIYFGARPCGFARSEEGYVAGVPYGIFWGRVFTL